MTVINTNVGALMARTYATKANDKMQTSMERLSSGCLLYTSPSPRDAHESRMPSSA